MERHYAVEISEGDLVAGALESLGNLADILIKAGARTRFPAR